MIGTVEFGVKCTSCSSISSHMYSLCSPQPSSLMHHIYMDIGHDFAKALAVVRAVVFQYAIILKRGIAWHVTNLFNLAPSCHACQFFIQGFALRFAFIHIISNAPLYGHVICMNYYETNKFINCYKNLFSLKIRPFYKNFLPWKFGAIQ